MVLYVKVHVTNSYDKIEERDDKSGLMVMMMVLAVAVVAPGWWHERAPAHVFVSVVCGKMGFRLVRVCRIHTASVEK